MIETETFSVGTAEPVRIVRARHTSQDVRLHNHAHQNSRFVYVGGSAVSAATGFDIASDAYVSLTVPAGDELWAIGSHTIEFHVMRMAK